jgi:hypothetical protein
VSTLSTLSRGGVSLPASLPPLAPVSSMPRGVLAPPRRRGLIEVVDEIFDIIDEILGGAAQSR